VRRNLGGAGSRGRRGNWHVATPTGSTAKTEWKVSLRETLLNANVPEQMPGALFLEIVFRCAPRRRNWVNLWKPAGDALGPMLGEPNPRNPFNPADDMQRVVGGQPRSGIERQLDDSHRPFTPRRLLRGAQQPLKSPQ